MEPLCFEKLWKGGVFWMEVERGWGRDERWQAPLQLREMQREMRGISYWWSAIIEFSW
jgi:hypothetical protein